MLFPRVVSSCMFTGHHVSACSRTRRNCWSKVIYGQSFSTSVSCDVYGTLDISVDISGTAFSFTDSACGTLTLLDSLASTTSGVYVYVGADCDGCTSKWGFLQAGFGNFPTSSPVVATPLPTNAPTHKPTNAPTHAPMNAPTHAPTNTPTHAPSSAPNDDSSDGSGSGAFSGILAGVITTLVLLLCCGGPIVCCVRNAKGCCCAPKQRAHAQHPRPQVVWLQRDAGLELRGVHSHAQAAHQIVLVENSPSVTSAPEAHHDAISTGDAPGPTVLEAEPDAEPDAEPEPTGGTGDQAADLAGDAPDLAQPEAEPEPTSSNTVRVADRTGDAPDPMEQRGDARAAEEEFKAELPPPPLFAETVLPGSLDPVGASPEPVVARLQQLIETAKDVKDIMKVADLAMKGSQMLLSLGSELPVIGSICGILNRAIGKLRGLKDKVEDFIQMGKRVLDVLLFLAELDEVVKQLPKREHHMFARRVDPMKGIVGQLDEMIAKFADQQWFWAMWNMRKYSKSLTALDGELVRIMAQIRDAISLQTLKQTLTRPPERSYRLDLAIERRVRTFVEHEGAVWEDQAIDELQASQSEVEAVAREAGLSSDVIPTDVSRAPGTPTLVGPPAAAAEPAAGDAPMEGSLSPVAQIQEMISRANEAKDMLRIADLALKGSSLLLDASSSLPVVGSICGVLNKAISRLRSLKDKAEDFIQIGKRILDVILFLAELEDITRQLSGADRRKFSRSIDPLCAPCCWNSTS